MANLNIAIKIAAQDAASGPIKAITGALGGLGNVAGGVLVGGLVVATAGVAALGAGLYTSIGAAMESEKGQAQLAAVLESTGGAAGMTADEVNALASQFQKMTPFEDDAILAGENLLLTFTNIGKDVFPMATETMLDMAAALGTDASGSAIQLGKALNDPVAGITALTRVGVTFTNEQKATIQSMVKMGDVAGAQKVILAELSKEFGGSAEAAGNTLTGKLEILKNTFGDIQETIGTAFLPVLTDLATLMADGLNSDMVQNALSLIVSRIQDVIAYALRLISIFQEGGFDRLFAVFEDGSSYIGGFLKSFGIAEGTAYAVGNAIAYFGQMIQNVIAYGLRLISIFQEGGFDRLFAVFEDGSSYIGGFIKSFGIAEGTAYAVGNAIAYFSQYAMSNLSAFYAWITTTAIPTMMAWNEAFIMPALDALINQVLPALLTTATGFYSWLTTSGIPGITAWGASIAETLTPYLLDLQALLNEFIAAVMPPLQSAWQAIVTVWTAEVGPALAELWASLNELFVALGIGTGDTDFWSIALGVLKVGLAFVVIQVQILTPIIQALGAVIAFGTNNVRIAVDMFRNFVTGLSTTYDAVTRLISKVQELADALLDLVIPDVLQPGSPTPFEMGLRGIASAIDSMPNLNFMPPQLALAGASAGAAGQAEPFGAGLAGPQTTNSSQWQITIYANDEAGGQRAANSFIETLRAKGLK